MDLLKGIDVKIENYTIIYKKLKPKINMLVYLSHQKYRLDEADVESKALECLEKSILRWDKERGLSFENYFYLNATSEIKNLYIKERAQKRTAVIVPIHKVKQKESDDEEGEEVVGSTYTEDRMLDNLVVKDLLNKLIVSRPKYADFIGLLLDGWTVKELAGREGKSEQCLYFRFQRVLKKLGRIAELDKKEEEDIKEECDPDTTPQ